MKKILASFLIALLVFFFSSSMSHASVIFSDSFSGGYNSSLWTLASGSSTVQTSSFGLQDNNSNVTLNSTASPVPIDNVTTVDVKVNSTPSYFYLTCRANGTNQDFVMGEFDTDGTTWATQFIHGGGGRTQGTNWNTTQGVHSFEVDCAGDIVTIKEDGVTLYSGDHAGGSLVQTFSSETNQNVVFQYRLGNSEFANYQFCDNTGCTSTTPTPTPTPTLSLDTISLSPSSSTITVGQPFSTTVVVSGGQAFNAAKATVSVSSNLTVDGIQSAPSPECNMNYTQSPTASNPSFAGAIYGSSSTNCNVYTITLTPVSVGTGTITFTNASIKAYADNSDILSGVTNGSFTINPAPTPTGTTTQTIDDSIQGSGSNQWNYNGSGWGHCTSCSETNPTVTFYNASQSWDKTANDYVTLSFTGEQFKLYGVTDPKDGIGAVSIDGGAETNVDFYSPTRTGDVLLWTSPILSNSSHTIKLRVTGTHNSNATDNYIVLDRGDILSQTMPTNLSINTYPTDTYNSTLTISGTKDSSITTVYINGDSSNVTYPTNTTWQATISLPTLGNNAFVIYGKDGNNTQTASINIAIDKHTLGDINGDGVVDLTDASLFAVDYGKTSNLTYPLSDMNSDGSVDLTDLSILAKLLPQ